VGARVKNKGYIEHVDFFSDIISNFDLHRWHYLILCCHSSICTPPPRTTTTVEMGYLMITKGLVVEKWQLGRGTKEAMKLLLGRGNIGLIYLGKYMKGGTADLTGNVIEGMS